MPRKSPAPYSGILNEPIVRRHPVPGGSLGDTFDLDRGRIRQIQIERFKLLFEHYRIGLEDPDHWEHLALSLALVHVPGLRTVDSAPRTRGRPKTRDLRNRLELVATVDAIAAGRKHGIADAIRTVVRRYPGKWPTKDGRPRKSSQELAALESRYYEAKSRIKAIERNARGPLHDLMGLIEFSGPTKKET
jgi:hypothetical protein